MFREKVAVASIMSKSACKLKAIAFTELCLNMLFAYFWIGCNSKIVDL